MIEPSTPDQRAVGAAAPDDGIDVLTPDGGELSKNAIVGFFKHDRRARPFSLLRTQLRKRLDSHDLKLIGICSATPGAGKSFIALNLAASLSRVSTEDIYLVDLDLRRASVAEALGFTPDVGLSNYLDGEVPDILSLGRRVEGTKLIVIPTAVCVGDTAEMIASPLFSRMIETLKTKTGNATIFFDLPPAFANDDAMLAIRELDGYLLVVDAGRNNKKQILSTMSMLAPAPCIGTVLNRYDGGLVDSYGYGYGYGYGQSKYDKYYGAVPEE